LADETSGKSRQKSGDNAREKTARVYGVKENIIRRYLEIYRLIGPLLDRLDADKIIVTAAQTISFIPVVGQTFIAAVLNEDEKLYKVTKDNAKKLRGELENREYDSLSGEEEALIMEKIRGILTPDALLEDAESESEFVIIQFPKLQYERLFSEFASDEVVDMIIQAVEFYRENSFYENRLGQQEINIDQDSSVVENNEDSELQ